MLYHTWLWTLFGDFGCCFRAGGGTHTLIGRIMDATWNSCWDVFARFHVLQPHWRCLKGLHSPSVAVSIDFEKRLGLVFLKVSIISIGHPALIQAFILFPHFWNLQLVGDVIPLYFHCLQICQENKQTNMLSGIILSLGRLYWHRACPEKSSAKLISGVIVLTAGKLCQGWAWLFLTMRLLTSSLQNCLDGLLWNANWPQTTQTTVLIPINCFRSCDS